eukprot:tig00000821_g4482.t1
MLGARPAGLALWARCPPSRAPAVRRAHKRIDCSRPVRRASLFGPVRRAPKRIDCSRPVDVWRASLFGPDGLRSARPQAFLLLKLYHEAHRPSDLSLNICRCVTSEIGVIAANLGALAKEEDFSWLPVPLLHRILCSPTLGLNRFTAVAIFGLVERYCEGLDDGEESLGLLLRPLARFCTRHWVCDCACQSLAGGFSPHACRRYSVELSGREVDDAERRPRGLSRSPPPAPRLGPIASLASGAAPPASPCLPGGARRASCPAVSPNPRQEASLRRTSLPALSLPPAAPAAPGDLYSASVAAGVFRMDLEEGAGAVVTPLPLAGTPDWGFLAGARLASPRASDEGDLEEEGGEAAGDAEPDDDEEAASPSPPPAQGLTPAAPAARMHKPALRFQRPAAAAPAVAPSPPRLSPPPGRGVAVPIPIPARRPSLERSP